MKIAERTEYLYCFTEDHVDQSQTFGAFENTQMISREPYANTDNN